MSGVYCPECGVLNSIGAACSNPLCSKSENARLPNRNAMFVSDGHQLIMWCPGCKSHKTIAVKAHEGYTGPLWSWNGDQDNVTIEPSIKSTGAPLSYCCHSFVKNGEWQFLSDCTHDLAGQTVPMEPVHI